MVLSRSASIEHSRSCSIAKLTAFACAGGDTLTNSAPRAGAPRAHLKRCTNRGRSLQTRLALTVNEAAHAAAAATTTTATGSAAAATDAADTQRCSPVELRAQPCRSRIAPARPSATGPAAACVRADTAGTKHASE